MVDYRKRCYDAYDFQWASLHSSTKQEYEFYSRVAKKKFAKIIPNRQDLAILDLACGAGHFLYCLKKRGYKNIRGIDIAEKQLEIAKSMGISEVEKADIFEYLPAHKENFDVVVAFDIIEHLKKDEVFKLLDAIRESLRPQGVVIIHTINASSLFVARSVYCDFTHEVCFTAISLLTVLRVCGFVDVKVFGDEPIAYDLRSLLRVIFWKLIKNILKTYCLIETGSGRGLWKREDVFEPMMYAVARKK